LQWNQQWVWPNFNIADALLVCGASLLLVQALFARPSTGTNTGEPKRVGSPDNQQ